MQVTWGNIKVHGESVTLSQEKNITNIEKEYFKNKLIHKILLKS